MYIESRNKSLHDLIYQSTMSKGKDHGRISSELTLKRDRIGSCVWILDCFEVINIHPKAPQYGISHLLQLPCKFRIKIIMMQSPSNDLKKAVTGRNEQHYWLQVQSILSVRKPGLEHTNHLFFHLFSLFCCQRLQALYTSTCLNV